MGNWGNGCRQGLAVHCNEVRGIWCAHDNTVTENEIAGLLRVPFNRKNKKSFSFQKHPEVGVVTAWQKQNSSPSGQGVTTP